MENKNVKLTDDFADKFLSAYKSPMDKAKKQKKKVRKRGNLILFSR